ncbi:MAG: hypothetical protein QM736_10170 [Vicinamibacterales bacterium]
MGPKQIAAMRDALVDLAAVRPTMARATLKAKPAAEKPASTGAHVLNYAARQPRATAPIKVALRPRMREAAPIAVRCHTPRCSCCQVPGWFCFRRDAAASTRGQCFARGADEIASLNGLASHRQPDSSRNVSASVPATSPVTKTTRSVMSGFCAIS